MVVRVSLLVLSLVACSDALAQFPGGGSVGSNGGGGGAGGSFEGGDLGDELGLVDGDGTTCSAPGLYFQGSPTTGFNLVDVGAAGFGLQLCVMGDVAGLISIGSTPATNSYGNTMIGWGTGAMLDLSGGGAGDDALHNTGVGAETLTKLTTGMQNTGVGNRVLHENVTGIENTAIGQGALYDWTGSFATAIGFHAQVNVAGGTNPNTAIGWKALEGTAGAGADATGDSNTVVGYESGYNFSSAQYNSSLGHQALKELTTGSRNTMVGWRSGDSVTTAVDLTCVGYDTCSAYTTQGTPITAFGRSALAVATVSNSSAFGYLALAGTTTGYSMTAMGHNAGVTNTTGFEGVAIGDQADFTANNTSGGIAIGYSTTVASDGIAIGRDITAAANHVQIGDVTNTEVKFGAIHTTGTGSLRGPAIAAAASATLPTCDVNTNRFGILPVDDTNDGAVAMLCWCRAGADDSTYSWVSVHDNSTSCVDP